MDRLISEQAVLKAVSKGCCELRGVYARCEEGIKAIPSAESNTGHWIVHEHAEEFYGRVVDDYECDNCGDWYLNKTNFCPNCGARMVKPQETKQPEISSYYGLKSYVRERSEE